MSKYRSRPTIVPWLSAKPDAREKRFIQVGNTLLLSCKFQELGAGARYLYLCMAMESGGRTAFILPQAAAKKYGISPSSLRRYINELESKKFIEVHSMKNLRKPNQYRFSFEWKAPSFHPSPMATCSKSMPR